MAGVKISGLPAAASSLTTDFFPAVQAGTTVRETLAQVLELFSANILLTNAGDPNGTLAGTIYQLCWDTLNSVLYICTTTGNATSAVWTLAGSIAFPITLAQGGTNKALTASNGGIVYTDADSMEILPATSTARQMLQSGASSIPAWSTAVYPATTTINRMLYSSAASVVNELATTNSAVLATSSAGVPTWLGSLTNGQVIIGSTGAIPVAATLSAGIGISISNTAGTVTISTSGAGTGWTDVTGATQTLVSNNGYIANRGAGNVAFTLPASSAVGDVIYIVGRQNGWSIAQLASQQIILLASSSTGGITGSIASTTAADCVTLICTVANLEWTINASMGNITVT